MTSCQPYDHGQEPILEPPSDIDQCHIILAFQAIFRSHFPKICCPKVQYDR